MATYVDQFWHDKRARAPEGRNSGGNTDAGVFEPATPTAGTSRNPDGTFAPGNPGKPPGTRHRTQQAVQALLEGEAEALTRKDPAVTFDLPPMQSAADTAQAAGAILAAVAAGELTPAEGAHAMALVETYRRTLETTELERRITALGTK